jgi:hypothetical protein
MNTCTPFLRLIYFSALAIFFLQACVQKNGAIFGDSKKQLKIVDSLLLAGKSDTNKLILSLLRQPVFEKRQKKTTS